MFKRMMSGLVVLAMLMSSACSEVGNHARTNAVHDGMRALGLAQMPDGTYEFRLCEMAEFYTPEVLREKCINPLVANNSLPLVFTEIPERPGTLVARIWNWGITLFVATAVGLSIYSLGSYIAKMKVINELSREANFKGLENALHVSQKYDHFDPKHLPKRLLKEDREAATTFTLVHKLQLKSGKEIDLRELLESKKLQKSLKKEEAREISELLLEFEEALRSGRTYTKTLVQGLDEMSDKGIPLVDGVLGKIVQVSKEGRLVLEDTIDKSLLYNRTISKEYREALQKLDTQVAGILGREAKSVSSRQRNIARLEAAAGLDEVLKVVEGVGGQAIVAAQKGDEKLLALTENNLHNMVEELGALVEDGSKGADEIKEKLTSMREQIDAAVAVWGKQTEELADVTVDAEVVRVMENFIKTTRKKTLKGWSKSTKEAKKELQKSLSTPAYETGAEFYQKIAHDAVYAEFTIDIKVKNTGEKIVEKVKKIVSTSRDKLGDNADDGLFISELEAGVRKANNFQDLNIILASLIKESSLFKSSRADGQAADELAALSAKITDKIKSIIETAQDEAESNKVDFSKGIFTRLRSFNLKDNKIFHYWDKDASTKLPYYKLAKGKDANNKLAVRIANREEIVARIANKDDTGKVRVEKGVEKLLGHLAGATTFVAIPVTALRQKLPEHARVSAANRWGDLTGSYELTAEGRVDDMHTIIKGIAEATGAKVSDEVFYFMLRSGLKNKQ